MNGVQALSPAHTIFRDSWSVVKCTNAVKTLEWKKFCIFFNLSVF